MHVEPLSDSECNFRLPGSPHGRAGRHCRGTSPGAELSDSAGTGYAHDSGSHYRSYDRRMDDYPRTLQEFEGRVLDRRRLSRVPLSLVVTGWVEVDETYLGSREAKPAKLHRTK